MATVLFYMFAAILMIIANKWVLLKMSTPLFFLLAQLLIAVLMFTVTWALGLFKFSLALDWAVCKGLWPMIAVNVIGLRYVLFMIVCLCYHSILSPSRARDLCEMPASAAHVHARSLPRSFVPNISTYFRHIVHIISESYSTWHSADTYISLQR